MIVFLLLWINVNEIVYCESKSQEESKNGLIGKGVKRRMKMRIRKSKRTYYCLENHFLTQFSLKNKKRQGKKSSIQENANNGKMRKTYLHAN